MKRVAQSQDTHQSQNPRVEAQRQNPRVMAPHRVAIRNRCPLVRTAKIIPKYIENFHQVAKAMILIQRRPIQSLMVMTTTV